MGYFAGFDGRPCGAVLTFLRAFFMKEIFNPSIPSKWRNEDSGESIRHAMFAKRMYNPDCLPQNGNNTKKKRNIEYARHTTAVARKCQAEVKEGFCIFESAIARSSSTTRKVALAFIKAGHELAPDMGSLVTHSPLVYESLQATMGACPQMSAFNLGEGFESFASKEAGLRQRWRTF